VDDDEVGPRTGSYRDAGVDIDAADLAKARIARLAASTHGPEVLRGVGHFGTFFQAPGEDSPWVLVSSADSVGTKILVANLVGRHQGIGVDLVNHCVNDILTAGARPLYFLDYFATADLNVDRLESVVQGMTLACVDAGCALVGGETAQLPGIYRPEAYDLAGFIVGAVHRDRIVDGSAVVAGDVLIGLPSNGLHTNGFSLARSALGLDGDAQDAHRRLAARPAWSERSLGDLLLEPHRSYLPVIAPLLGSPTIHAMAHVTGGGIAGNLARVIPDGFEAVVDVRAWDVPALFRAIELAADVSEVEMYRVFNMGIGFVVVVDAAHAVDLLERLAGARRIGEIRSSLPGGTARYAGPSTWSDAGAVPDEVRDGA